MPGSGPRFRDEVPRELWARVRHVHDWIAAGAPDWSLNLAVDHQMVRLGDDVIRADMLRGNRFTSVKVVRGDETTSLRYPPAGVYTFRYSLSSGPGDWKATLSYRAGLGFNNPLIPVGVSDEISRKTLPSRRSFGSIPGDGLILSALKRADAGPGVVLRVYEIQGAPVTTAVDLLGEKRSFQEVNLLEEKASAPSDVLRVEPYEIKTIRIDMPPSRHRPPKR
jgi:alpha-mannosidase